MSEYNFKLILNGTIKDDVNAIKKDFEAVIGK